MASVRDHEGKLVGGLDATHFRAKFRGKPVHILSAAVDSRPRRIVVLLDASGSMRNDHLWPLARSAAIHIASSVPVAANLALLVFDEKILERVGFREGPKAVIERLRQKDLDRLPLHKGSSGTALRDAILEGLKLLGPSSAGDVIYAITDGRDTRSRSKPAQMERALLAGGVRLFSYLLRSQVKVPEDLAEQRDFREQVSATGGNLFVLPDPDFLGQVIYPANVKDNAIMELGFKELYENMAEYYQLEVELPQGTDKLRKWKMSVKPPPGINKKYLRFVYQGKLAPCHASPQAK